MIIIKIKKNIYKKALTMVLSYLGGKRVEFKSK